MTRGRRPIAREVHQAKGTYRIHPERENKTSPLANGADPAMPKYFGAEEKRKWKELLSDFAGFGIVSSDLREIMIAYCTAYAGWMAARKKIKETGLAIESYDKNGELVITRNPYCLELHKYRDEMNRLLPELGLTPASRQKLVSLTNKEDDPFKEFLARVAN